jgi:peroxiredoxin
LQNILNLCFVIILIICILTIHLSCAPIEDKCHRIGDSLPELTLNDLNGKPVSFDNLTGKTLFIYAWAITCNSCQGDLILIQKLNTALKKSAQYKIISVNRSDSKKQIVDFMSKNNFDFTVLLDTRDSLFTGLCVRPSTPASILVGAKGNIKSIKWDAFRDEDELATYGECHGILNSISHPPQITGVSIVNLNTNYTLVRWRTDKEATGRVVVTDKNTCFLGGTDDALAKDHEITINLANLLENGVYDIEIMSQDSEGNETSVTKTGALAKGNRSKPASAPDFSLVSQSGKFEHLSDYAGKKVLLHFWSPSCHVCAEELPLMQSFYSGGPSEEIKLLTISVGGDITEVNNYVSERGFTFPVLFDSDGKVDSTYNNRAFPTSYLIDANGSVIDKKEGAFQSIYDIRQFTGVAFHLQGL